MAPLAALLDMLVAISAPQAPRSRGSHL